MSTTQPIKSKKSLKLFEDYFKHVKPNPRNYALIIVGLNSALRISDILHLTCSDVYDFQKKDWKSHIIVKEQKTGKMNRVLINSEMKKALAEYQKHILASPTEWLFHGQLHIDKPLSRYQAHRIIREAAKYAGLNDDISCHSLRKTFGYHAWKQGTPPALIMNIYNHSNFQVTKRYLCIDQDDRDAVFAEIKL